MYERVIAEINLDNLAYNVRNIKKQAQDARLMAVVKADAYGHGAVESAEVCLENGAEYLAVSNIDEALELRHNDINAPILILGDTLPERFSDVVENDIIQAIYSMDRAKALSETASGMRKTARVHIKTDTGMGRIGYLPCEESINEIMEINSLPYISVEGIFTHFATADSYDKTYTRYQAERFAFMCDSLKKRGLDLICHCSNSAAILELMPEFKYDMVRAGIILYGYYPSDEVKHTFDIKPYMSVKSYISHIKTIEAGASVSYGRTYIADKPRKIATVPVGYADGYMRLNSNKGRVIVENSYAPIVGRVCMDQFMIDVSHIQGLKTGDEVILLGEKNGLKIDADELAANADTISYEILCAISKRVPRMYIKDNKVVKTKHFV